MAPASSTDEPDLERIRQRPYQWQRLGGTIDMARDRHGIELLVYPISANRAAAALMFADSLYHAIYSYKPSFEGEIDVDVKQGVVGLSLVMARCFRVGAFALRRLSDVEDVAVPVFERDIAQWLVDPTSKTIARWGFMIAGIHLDAVERKDVERNWPASRLRQLGHDFLVYDGIV